MCPSRKRSRLSRRISAIEPLHARGTVVEEWKAENVYPYEGEAKSPLEDAERKVFDILAVTASDYMPDFVSAPPKKKAFDLRMLRTAIENSPEELQIIMNEVLGLPKRKQEELAELLREASLSSIISAAKIVADRLKFLAGLEQILFDTDMKARLKERSQLHKIIEDNTWLFGEEYNLLVSDRGLTAVLHKHRKILGDDVVIDRPVRHVSQERESLISCCPGRYVNIAPTSWSTWSWS